MELKIMILGTKNSGKTTLIGVLLNNKLDDGNGSARLKVLNHKHEVITGITSSLTYTAMAIDDHDEIIPS
jgi:elongation factor 1-alpha